MSKACTQETRLKQKISRCKYINKPVDDTERFWSYVDIKGENECWEWKGPKDRLGYGSTHYMEHKFINVHRLAWILTYGEIPEGKDVLHHCDNRACVNYLSHLFLGNHQDNMNDMIAKGRASHAFGSKHPRAKLTEEDIICIRVLFQTEIRISDIARMYKVDKSQIGHIVHKEQWTHI